MSRCFFPGTPKKSLRTNRKLVGRNISKGVYLLLWAGLESNFQFTFNNYNGFLGINFDYYIFSYYYLFCLYKISSSIILYKHCYQGSHILLNMIREISTFIHTGFALFCFFLYSNNRLCLTDQYFNTTIYLIRMMYSKVI